jgi:amino acid adenylation domain-containing protein
MRHPESPQFNTLVDIRLIGDVDVELLSDCVCRSVAHHESLNMRFGQDHGVPYQWVEPSVPGVAIIDFRGEQDPADEVVAWKARHAETPLDLAGGVPPHRLSILRESDSVVYLHMAIHHIVTDAWSETLLYQEILTDYDHVVRTGHHADLPGSAYSSFLRVEEEFRASPQFSHNLEQFSRAFSGVNTALFARRVPSRTARHTFRLEQEFIDAVRAKGVTPAAYMAAVLSVVLSRMHRSDDITLGLPILNRANETELQTHGLLSSVLPMHTRPAADRRLRALVADATASIAALRGTARVGLGDIVRSLPAEQRSRQLFDVTYSSLRLPAHSPVSGLTYEMTPDTPVHHQDALSVLAFSFVDQEDLHVHLNYALDVFDDDLPIETFASAFEHALRDGLAKFDRPVRDLALTGCPADSVLVGEDRPYERGATLHGLFERQVRGDPHRTALITADGTRTSYGQLARAADRIASGLRDREVQRGDRVAVMLERGPDLAAALFGVLKAGAAYVPVDPSYPAERVRFILLDSGATAVLTCAETPPAVAELPQAVAITDLLAADGPKLAARRQDSGPHDLAYVIYTSGSTGTPKGVMVEHHSVVNRLAWMQSRYPIGPGDVLLQKTSVSFDVSVWELFWWAIEGAALALPAPGAEKDPNQLLRAISRDSVTAIHFVPSMFGPFLDLLESDPQSIDSMRSIRHVFCSGEALLPTQVERFTQLFDGTDNRPMLTNLYGPTEATVDVSAFDCPRGPVVRVPIGQPIYNTRLAVVDENLSPVPPGFAGELVISGAGVARGYLDRQQLTAEKFLPDPGRPGERRYRTGDLARVLSDGTLEYLGRLDGQVKVRGNRVELGEVENALGRVPGVRATTVIHRVFGQRGRVLVAYYAAPAPIPTGTLRDALGKILPEFMIPAFFEWLDAIPLTPNGKVDRTALPAPGGQPAPSSTRPLSPDERMLSEVWAEVLGVEAVGPDDDYYALGGDSLLMLRIRALAQQGGLHFSLSDLMQHRTVAALVAHVVRAPSPQRGNVRERAAWTPFALVAGVDRARLSDAVDAFPLTQLQLGLIYHSRRYARSAIYKDVFCYTLRLSWEEEKFRAAYTTLVHRHPVLRSSFRLTGYTEPLQTVHASADAGLDVVDLRGLPWDDAEAAIGRHIEDRRYHEYAFEPSSLAYLLRAYVLPEHVTLVLSFHHALLDGSSIANLISELLRDYGHALGLHSSPVDELDLPSPALHAHEEREAIQGGKAARFWRTELEGCKPVSLNAFGPHEPRPAAGRNPASHRVTLSAPLVEDLRRLASERSLPVKALLFGAHCLTLSLLSGNGHVLTGLVTHTRPEQAGAERMLGLFLNTLPLRVDTRSGSWLGVAEEAFSREQRTHPHRHYPLSKIQEDVGAELFDTAFNYVRFHQLRETLALPGIEMVDVQTYEQTNFALLVNAIADPVDGTLWLRIDNDGQAITDSQVHVYADYYVRILDRLVHKPDEAPGWAFLANYPVSAPALPAESSSSVVDLFAARAEFSPQGIAVVHGEERWTYADLAAVATVVAENLRAKGVGSGSVVGVAADRTPETVAITIGAMRAGAAVMPLDTDYPPRRLAYMVERTGPSLIIAAERHERLLDSQWPIVRPGELTAGDPCGGTFPRLAPDDMAVVLFTSGSTGRPKAVAVPHRTLTTVVSWQNRGLSACAGVTLQYAALSFDVSLQEIFSTLCAGGTLYLVPEATRRDMPALLRLIDREGVERVFMPYVAFQQLAVAAKSLGITPRRLKVIVCGGEQLRITEEIRQLCSRLPNVVLDNHYGPTESHVVTVHSLTGPPEEFPDLPPVGVPVENADVLVLDADRRPVPPGVTGEIYIGGSSVALGYLGREDLTQERFVRLPGRAGRYYRTGDLAFRLPNGEIVFVGRADTQVKVRGYRVETAEVELAIREMAAAQYPSIRDVAVVAQARSAAETVLAAFLIGDPASLETGAIRSRLRQVLPDYMVPSHFQWLEAMPSTPSGKRDDAALRALPLEAPARPDAVPPRTEHERVLAEVLADLLHLPVVGVQDNIFDLGGTSLTAMRLMVAVEERFQVNVPLSELIAAPTVAGLAHLLAASSAKPAPFHSVVPIKPMGSRTPLFLVHPMGGNVLCFLPLARHLPAPQPLYGLQSAGADPGTIPLRSIEEMASSYIEDIKMVQPQGPYVLGGFSFGGFVAFEMTRQLLEAREDVAQTLLLDTVALNSQQRAKYNDDALLGWFFWELLWPVRGGTSPVARLPSDIATTEQRFDYIADQAVRLGVLPSNSSDSLIRRLFRVYRANWHATLAYRPNGATLDLTLLRSEDPLPEFLEAMHGPAGSLHYEATNGWNRMTSGNVRVIPVAGDHLSIMEEPRVVLLAATVAELAITHTDASSQKTSQS